MFEPLKKMQDRFGALEKLLADPNVLQDSKRYVLLHKEYSALSPIITQLEAYQKAAQALKDNDTFLAKEKDLELIALAKEEKQALAQKLKAIEDKLKTFLEPKDPNDHKNVIVELRAGIGGDEAGIWAGDLFRMYQRFVENKGWKLRILSFTESSSGGYKEIIVNILGNDVYKYLKYESGVHRVQRVPATETQGRIHTSAASVVVLPEIDPVQVDIDMNEVKKETFCSSGPGGQSVNTTYSAVRLTHIPTGITASCQDGKSQIKNFEQALKVLRARLYERALSEQKTQVDQKRKSMISTGDRSVKIRTYNYPNAYVKDHRINWVTHNLAAFLGGDLDTLIEKLHIADREDAKLK